MRNHHGRSFRFSSVHVHGGLFRGAARGRFDEAENIDDIVVLFLELALSEIRQQTFVPTVAVYDDDLLAPVARHLVGGFLQQFQLHVAAVGDGAGLVPRLKNLPKIIFWKHNCILLLGRMEGCITDVEQVSAYWQMRSMLFQYSEGQQACSTGVVNRLHKIWRRKILPVHRKFSLRVDGGRNPEQYEYGY